MTGQHRATVRNLIDRLTPPAAAAGVLTLVLAAAIAPAAASVTAPISAPIAAPPAANTPAPLITYLGPAPSPSTAKPAAVNPAPAKTTTVPAPPAAKPAVAAGWVHPLPNGARGSGGGCFGTYRATPWVHYHGGVDLSGPYNMPIRAVHSGVIVVQKYQSGGAGNYVAVDHGNGYQSVYMHLIRPGLPVGTHVQTGQVIGYVGATGDAQGPHLHFEIHHGLWHQIDPATFMRDRGVNVGC